MRTGLGAIAVSLMLAACSHGSMKSDLRVVYASADAPPVNVLVGKKKFISNLDYAEGSGYVEVRSETRQGSTFRLRYNRADGVGYATGTGY